MKKIGLLLIIVLVFAILPVCAEAEAIIYLNETFENYTTNSVPSTFSVSGAADVIVKEYLPLKKALYVNKKGYNSTIKQKIVTTQSDVVFQADIKMSGGSFASGISFYNATTKLTPVLIDDNGMKTRNGKYFADGIGDKWSNLAICFHFDTKSYDVYINGEKKLNDWRLDAAGVKKLDTIEFAFQPSKKNSEIYIDNLRMYGADEPLADKYFSSQPYNEKSIEYVDLPKEAGESVIGNYDFTSRIMGSIASKSNSISLMKEAQNGFCRFEMAGTEDAYIDLSLTAEFPYVVYEADVRLPDLGSTLQFYCFKLNPDYAFNWTAYVKPGGSVTLYNNTSVGTLSQGEWYKLAAAYDFLSKTFDFYINGKQVAKGIPIQLGDKEYPAIARFHVFGPADSKVDIDNVRIYEGKEPKVFSEEKGSSGNLVELESLSKMWTDNSVSEKLLSGTVAFHASSGAMFLNGQKTYPKRHAYIKDKIIYLPIRSLAEIYNQSVAWDAEQKATVLNGSVTLKMGKSEFSKDGKSIAFDGVIHEKDGVSYIPVSCAKELFGVSVHSNWDGLVILDSDIEYSVKDESEINSYMMNQRPTVARIKKDFATSGHQNSHPRVLINQNRFDEIRELVLNDSWAKELYGKLKKKAMQSLDTTVSIYDIPDGLRLLDTSRRVLNRVALLSMVYKIEGDEKYAQRAYKELESAANFPDWNPQHYLDTAEMCMAFAIGYDWLYDYMTAEQREVIKKSFKKNGIDVYLEKYAAKEWWTNIDSNWAFVCSGGAIAMSAALMDDYPEECSALVENALRGTENAFPRFAPDGSWYEGPGYWEYSVLYLNYLIPTLEATFGTDYDLSKSAGLNETVNYILNMRGSVYDFGYSDMTTPGITSHTGSTWLSHVFDNPSWADIRKKNIRTYGVEHFTDLLWYYPSVTMGESSISLPLDSYYRNAEVAAHRSSWSDTNMLYLAYKGGLENQSHGHFDNGSFVFDLGGVRWADDLGADNYNMSGYFSYNSTPYYRKRAEGHNTVVIFPNDTEVEQNPNGLGKIEKFVTKEKGSFGVLNLDDVYNATAKSMCRGFYIGDNRNSVTVRDEIDLKEKNSTVYWFMHTRVTDLNKFKVDGNSMIITDTTGAKLKIDFITNATDAKITVMDSAPLPDSPNPDGQGVNNGKKVAIKLTGSGKVNLTVKMYDESNSAYVKPIKDISIDKWTVDDGSVEVAPVLSGIYADGKLIDDFSPLQTEYKIMKNMDEKDPIFTANAQEGTLMTVSNPAEGITIYTLRNPNNPLILRTYKVIYKKIPYLVDDLSGYTRLIPETITASRVPETDNSPKNVLDDNFQTRFAVDGTNEWILLDMGKVVAIDAYAIAYYMGTVRTSAFDILVSEDGVNYQTLFKGATTGLTEHYELFKTTDTKVRYFKLVGHGNSNGIWNSPTEISLLVKD